MVILIPLAAASCSSSRFFTASLLRQRNVSCHPTNGNYVIMQFLWLLLDGGLATSLSSSAVQIPSERHLTYCHRQQSSVAYPRERLQFALSAATKYPGYLGDSGRRSNSSTELGPLCEQANKIALQCRPLPVQLK